MTLCKITKIHPFEPTMTGGALMLGGEYVNEGLDGPTFIRLIDTKTGEFLNMAVGYYTHPTGATRGMVVYASMPAKSWKLTLEVGEGDPADSVDVHDSKSFVIINPEFPPEEDEKPLLRFALILSSLVAGVAFTISRFKR